MASACVNNIPTTAYGWLSPSHEPPSSPDPPDFEFHLSANNNNNPTMLSADQLFSHGKLVPLHFFSSAAKTAVPPSDKSSCKSMSEDPYLFSPKAPRCSSRWRDLFGLKKLNQTKTTPTSSTPSNITNRNSKTASSSSVDSSLSLPLLKDSLSLSSSRLSLSSSSSGHDSLDAEKPITHRSGPKVRTRPRMENPRVSVDSPRMNPSGKVVFQSLERSSSSPSSFNKHHHRGVMERSYSGNVHVRITPVLNVPVCSLRASSKSGVFGFSNLFSSSSSSSSQKKEGSNNGSTKRNKKEEKEKEKEKESG